MTQNNHVKLGLIITCLLSLNTIGAMQNLEPELTPEQQYALNYETYCKTIALWRYKKINVYKATLPQIIIHPIIDNHKTLETKITKIFSKNSCFDAISKCFCVQRSYHLERTINTRGWEENEKFYSNAPQTDRFDHAKNIVTPITLMQKAPCEITETFKKGLEDDILSICKKQKPSLQKYYTIWSPDFLHVAFVCMGDDNNEDIITVMTPVREHNISLSRGSDTYFNFK